MKAESQLRSPRKGRVIKCCDPLLILITIMTMKNPDDKIRGESALAYAAFIHYRDERDLNTAYSNFMQSNVDALTSMNAFVKWASTYNWQRRVNKFDDWQELRDKREIRLLARENTFTAETMAQELYTCCMEEMRLKQGDMTHRDISKYMDICQKIGERSDKKPEVSPVTVNVEQTVAQTVDVSDEVLMALGKKLVEAEHENSV